jgi:hypothetical protein
VSPNGDPSLIRVQERETGFFSDLECLLERLIPLAAGERERSSRSCSARTEQIPFTKAACTSGQYQRIFLVAFEGPVRRRVDGHDRRRESDPSRLIAVVDLRRTRERAHFRRPMERARRHQRALARWR